MSPKVWVYCVCRDERQIIEYFLRHYCTFAEKIIMYDAASVDGTREIIAACPQAELRDYPGAPGIRDDELLDFAHNVWLEARCHADWICYVDCDEFVYHPQMLDLLARYLREGVQVPQILGYTMFSREFPTTSGQIYEQIKAGVVDDCWNKPAIFRDMAHFTMGRHGWDFTISNPRRSRECEIKLLHYRGLGEEYVRWRHQRNWARVPDAQRRMHLGTNTDPNYVGHHSVDWFLEVMSRNLPHVI